MLCIGSSRTNLDARERLSAIGYEGSSRRFACISNNAKALFSAKAKRLSDTIRPTLACLAPGGGGGPSTSSCGKRVRSVY